MESRVLHRGKFLEFRIETIERTDGSRATRDIAGHPGAVAVVAVDADDRVVLVRQWRLPADDALLEIPAGGLDVLADGTKEDPELAARRELEEETGLRAATWRKLGEFFSAPGFTDELMHLYLATDLTPAHPGERLGPDEDERLVLSWLPWRDAVRAAEDGTIRDAKSIAGLFWLARIRSPGEPAVAGTTPAGATGGAGSVGDVDAAPSDRADATVGEVARASYRMSMGEVVQASIVVTRRSAAIRVMGLAMAAVALFGIVATGDLVSLGVLVVALLFLSGLFGAPIAWYQARKRPDIAFADVTLTVDERGVHAASPISTGLMRWDTFRAVHESSGLFFLDTSAGAQVIIPRRVFAPADLATFYRLIDRHRLLGVQSAG